MKSFLLIFILLVVIGALVFFSYPKSQESSDISRCLLPVGERLLPEHIGEYKRVDLIPITHPLNFIGELEKTVNASGYMAIYRFDTKGVFISALTLEEDNYKKFMSNAERAEGDLRVKKISWKGTTAYVIEFTDPIERGIRDYKTIFWQVFANDGTYLQFGFSGFTFEESQHFMNLFAENVC